MHEARWAKRKTHLAKQKVSVAPFHLSNFSGLETKPCLAKIKPALQKVLDHILKMCGNIACHM
jgi:hypothetical protein